MARPSRIGFAGALYGVAGRGEARKAIYLDNRDRQGFLDQVQECASRF